MRGKNPGSYGCEYQSDGRHRYGAKQSNTGGNPPTPFWKAREVRRVKSVETYVGPLRERLSGPPATNLLSVGTSTFGAVAAEVRGKNSGSYGCEYQSDGRYRYGAKHSTTGGNPPTPFWKAREVRRGKFVETYVGPRRERLSGPPATNLLVLNTPPS